MPKKKQPFKNIYERLADRVAEHADEAERINEGLWEVGPELVNTLAMLSSLRDLARDTGYSPTYLSRVRSGHVRISEQAYLDLARKTGWK